VKQEWIQRPEGGGRGPIRLVIYLAQACGRTFTRGILYPITLYFVLRRGPERRASGAFLKRILHDASWLSVAKHIHCFSSVTLDRVYLLRENLRRFDVQCFGLDELRRVLEQGKGVLLFGAHVGSFEALRALAVQQPDIPFRAVIDIGQNPAFSEVFGELNPELAETIINARRDGLSTVFDIKEALDSRAIVSMLVDRARPGNAVTSVDFIGDPAPFPNSPWLLASTLQVPVMLCFGLYRGGNRYDLHFEPFAEAVDIPRRDRAAALQSTIRRYAERLEYYVRMAPYNWFNFYDFWKS
jgi:predicted LPLAT superfamily acyltransferase